MQSSLSWLSCRWLDKEVHTDLDRIGPAEEAADIEVLYFCTDEEYKPSQFDCACEKLECQNPRKR